MRRSFSSAGVVEARPETVDRPVPSAASFLRRDGNAVFKYFQTRAETPPDHVQGATTLFDLLIGASWPKTCAKQPSLEFDRLKKGLFTRLKW
jgi:hypothetical protein